MASPSPKPSPLRAVFDSESTEAASGAELTPFSRTTHGRAWISRLPLPPRQLPFIKGCFVTGFARSGTTFLGTALSRDRRCSYIHEPFSGSGIDSLPWDKFSELDPNSLEPTDPIALDAIERLRWLDFQQLSNLTDRGPVLRQIVKRILGSRGPFSLFCAKCYPFADFLLVKDPVGNAFAPYLAKRFGFSVVVIVKHPVSNFASYERIGWTAKISALHGHKSRTQFYDPEELEWANRDNCSLSREERFAVTWRLEHRFLWRALEGLKNCRFVTHEAVSRQPDSIAAMAKDLDIPWSGANNRWLARNTTADKIDANPDILQDLKRNSAGIFQKRMESVSPTVRRKIEDICWPVAQHFYDQTEYFV